MSAQPYHHQSFPRLPGSLSNGDYEMQDRTHDTYRPSPNTAQSITPYLGLRARLSQVWINRWTVLLFLVLARTLLAIVGLNNDLGSAKTEALSACSGVESMGSAMASMPHYLSAGVNELAASGIEHAVHALMSMLDMTITGLEELLVFVFNMLTSTYVCLITLVIRGSLHVALDVIEKASDAINSTIKGISTELSDGVKTFEDGFNKFVGTLSSIPSILGGGDKDGAPKLNVDDVTNKLNNLQLPPGLDEDLTKLNDSIPTFSDVQNFTDNLIRTPFEMVKKLIDGRINYQFNHSMFPVPEKEKLSFCSDNDGISKFFKDLADQIQTARRAFIAVLVIVALLVCIPMAYREIRRWRIMQERAQLVRDKSLDPLDAVYIVSRPYTATAGIKAASPFQSSKRQTLTRWVVAYATSPPALFVLTLGITGLFACLCQYILLKTVEKEVPALANQVGDFADKVVTTLNNVSQKWADGTNGAIIKVNDDINHDIFGWVNTTTGAINSTIDAFISNATSVINTTFHGTILQDPVNELFNCLIGLKAASIQKGLTWVSDNAHVSFPLIPNNTFSLGAAESIGNSSKSASDTGASPNADESFLANPGSQATDQITNAVVKVTTHIAEAIRTEAIISTVIILIYLLVVGLGVGRAVYLCLRREKLRAEGGGMVEPKPRRPFMSVIRGPAPAYEPRGPAPPVPASPVYHPDPDSPSDHSATTAATTPYRPFRGFSTPIRNDTTSSSQRGEKEGHAGFRLPARTETAAAAEGKEDAWRRSVYPTVEKS